MKCEVWSVECEMRKVKQIISHCSSFARNYISVQFRKIRFFAHDIRIDSCRGKRRTNLF